MVWSTFSIAIAVFNAKSQLEETRATRHVTLVGDEVATISERLAAA